MTPDGVGRDEVALSLAPVVDKERVVGCREADQVAFLLDKGRSHPRGCEDNVSSFGL